MKKIQKLTVLASTVLLSTVISPKAHAESENINNNIDKSVKASESLEDDQKNSDDISNEDLKNNLGEEENLKEEKSQEPEMVTTYSTNTDNFSKDDLYIYSKVDLDQKYIGNKSSSSSKPTKSEPTKEEIQTNLKEVDKSSDGRYVLKTDGNKYYYYDNGVLMKNKDTVLNGKFYTLGSDGSANVAKNKWVNVNGVKYYANENGYTQIGLKKIGNTTYYFENNGKLSSNKTIFKNKTFYKINNNGIASAIKNQWVTYNGQTYFANKYAGMANGFTNVSGKLYLFDNGSMVKNIPVLYSGDKFYNIDSKGQVTKFTNSWVNYKGNKFYTNQDGWRCEGITNINGKVYNLTKSGMAKDYYVYSEKDNATYYFDNNGVGTIVSRGKPSKDLDVMMGWMYDGMNNNMTYDMGAGRTSQNASDCSSAVFRSMIQGGFRDEGSFIGNTETLFSLGKKGEVLKEVNENEIRYGDIFVAGTPGNSLGAGGHTGFIVDKNTIIHSNYTDNGISVTQRKGRMGDASGFPVKYYRLVGGTSRKLYI